MFIDKMTCHICNIVLMVLTCRTSAVGGGATTFEELTDEVADTIQCSSGKHKLSL